MNGSPEASTGQKNKMANLPHPYREMPLFHLVPNRPHYHTLFIPTKTRAILVVDGINQGALLFWGELLPNRMSPGHMPPPPAGDSAFSTLLAQTLAYQQTYPFETTYLVFVVRLSVSILLYSSFKPSFQEPRAVASQQPQPLPLAPRLWFLPSAV
jgi:hypothetical protein